ncbi:hypothetical protein GWI33_004717 [Rhynchophorus ferrugineus]|uniref:Uncharacterized protein n=1 Tax=Rhynchophorus ferrugineus TaxID=354439 RepID=A0A834IP47_RHYFE|nr:hypothetical protein GWI33_004717 [Rhynchophorus ferrugineus]
MVDLFSFELDYNRNEDVIEFIERLTTVKIMKSEYLPSGVCLDCTNRIKTAYIFYRMCKTSDELLKKEETRRKFRKIEEEALLDENEIIDDVPVDDDSIHLIKHEETEQNLSSTSENSLQAPSYSDSESAGKNDDQLPRYKTAISKPVIHVKDKYKCDKCLMSFSNKIKFLGHQKVHDNTKPFRCDICLQSFLKEIHLKVHLRSHVKSEEKKFACKTCGKQFIFAYLLKQHEYKHSDQKPFPCPKCNKGCLTSETLRRHMRVHDDDYRKKAYVCTICRKEFPYPSSLSEHMKLHTGEKPHLCSMCGKGFRQVGSLHYHQRIHTGLKPFECKLCGDRFMSRSLLKDHMRKHTNERPFVCDYCGMSFRQSNGLKSHTRTHTGERPVLCTICGKKLSTTGQLTIHLRSHTGEKPYQCGDCSKAFTTNALLKKHTRIHTGERPYVCGVCDKAFSQSSTLKTHSLIHKSSPVAIKSPAKAKPTRARKKEPKGKATVRIDVQEKDTSEIKTEFTVILPAPIPLIIPNQDM